MPRRICECHGLVEAWRKIETWAAKASGRVSVGSWKKGKPLLGTQKPRIPSRRTQEIGSPPAASVSFKPAVKYVRHRDSQWHHDTSEACGKPQAKEHSLCTSNLKTIAENLTWDGVTCGHRRSKWAARRISGFRAPGISGAWRPCAPEPSPSA